jgi:uncharacterized protein (DUF302 family)
MLLAHRLSVAHLTAAAPVVEISFGDEDDSCRLSDRGHSRARVGSRLDTVTLSNREPLGIVPGGDRSASSVQIGASQQEFAMPVRSIAACSTFTAAAFVILVSLTGTGAAQDGLIRVRSAYPFHETVEKLKQDIASKGIKLFDQIDQSKLAADAGIELKPSVLLVFGNPPLGTQFIAANANAGLDWPVRLLVFENDKGEVWTAYTDFGWIARRHKIESRDEQFKMASHVIDSITSSVKAK